MYEGRYYACIGIFVAGLAFLAFGLLSAHVIGVLMPVGDRAGGMWIVAGMFIASGAAFAAFGLFAALRWRLVRRRISR